MKTSFMILHSTLLASNDYKVAYCFLSAIVNTKIGPS